jgi:hypothetical protein
MEVYACVQVSSINEKPQKEADSKHGAGSFFDLFFDPEDDIHIFPRIVG